MNVPATRSGTAFVAHCLLNQNAKVGDAAYCAGVSVALVESLRAQGWRIEQLPCPELAFAGLNRYWQTKEQYDTAAYWRHCRRLAAVVADMIATRSGQGADVAVIGVEGSPSMGVYVTSSDPARGGRPEPPGEYTDLVAGSGIFVTEMRRALAERGLPSVPMAAETHDLPGERPDGELSGAETLPRLPG